MKGRFKDVDLGGARIMGGLTVQGVTAAAISIVGNSVGTLFVGNSGPPIEISDNHAVRATCSNNKGQTGSGNKVSGPNTNTCPR